VKGYRVSNTGPFQLSVLPLETNDSCEVAESLDLPVTSTLGSTRNSTTVASPTVCRDILDSSGAWYEFDGDGSVQCVTLSTEQPPSLPSFPASLSLFSGTDCSSLTCVDTMTSEEGREIGFRAEAGTTYRFLVQGTESVSEGDFLLQTREAPLNGICSEAIAMNADSSTTFKTLHACIEDIAENIDQCSTPVRQNEPGVWFTTTGTGNYFLAHLSGDGTGCERMQVSVYEGSSCSSLKCTGWSTISCIDDKRSAGWFTEAGAVYYLYVQTADAETPLTLEIEENIPVIPDTCADAVLLEEDIVGSTEDASMNDLGACASTVAPGVLSIRRFCHVTVQDLSRIGKPPQGRTTSFTFMGSKSITLAMWEDLLFQFRTLCDANPMISAVRRKK